MVANQALAIRFQEAVKAQPEPRKSAFRRLQVVDGEYVEKVDSYRRNRLVKRPHRVETVRQAPVSKQPKSLPHPQSEAPVQVAAASRSQVDPVVRPEAAGSKGVIRWIVAAIAIITLCFGLGTAMAPGAWDGPVDTVQVSAGQSLWSLAADLHIASMSDDEVVDTIVALNHLDSTTVQPGQTLIVPGK